MPADPVRTLAALAALYRIHDRLTGTWAPACTRGCSTCCTRNVTLTSLEAFYLLDGLDPETRSGLLDRIAARRHLRRLTPAITINTMADLCMKGLPVPDEDSDPAWGPCPLLDEGLCTVYDRRPFACRSMVSLTPCGPGGMADMTELMMTVGTVFMQYLEHLDPNGCFANLSDLLPLLSETGAMAAYRRSGTCAAPDERFLKNRPLSVLMIPPDQREALRPILMEFQTL
ncbi:hypothetical protein JCM14469_27600 [Desulfatiferula olefinivorans]